MFDDRRQAGRRLAGALARYVGEEPIVVGLPRGGVPVAYEVALALDAPLDVIIVRKLGVPFQPELGMGAIGEGGARVLNEEIVRLAQVGEPELVAVEHRERAEIERRVQRYRHGRTMVPLEGRTVIVVDDGIATGGTMRAALQVARAHAAKKVVLAVPVAAPDTIEALRADADEIVVLEEPRHLVAIGSWYRDFRQTPDDDVVRLLEAAARTAAARAKEGAHAGDCVDAEVAIHVDGVVLGGRLAIPEHAHGVVVFAHGSGSSRHSPRNRSVASVLQERGWGTLLFDLLTEDEAVDRANVFDIALLARRLVAVTEWLRARPEAHNLKIGYFGASTGAAAAVQAAADLGDAISAVVSRGGRPDLAFEALSRVHAPTLLIVGGRDDVVVQLNRRAAARLRCEHRLVVIEGATHLFEEAGTLRQAATLAQEWFAKYLSPAVPPTAPAGSS